MLNLVEFINLNKFRAVNSETGSEVMLDITKVYRSALADYIFAGNNEISAKISIRTINKGDVSQEIGIIDLGVLKVDKEVFEEEAKRVFVIYNSSEVLDCSDEGVKFNVSFVDKNETIDTLLENNEVMSGLAI